jgi:hypothetical protein
LSEQQNLSALKQAGTARDEDPEMHPGTDSSALSAKPRRRKPRGMFLLPSVFTAGNIAAGYFAITQSLQGSALEPQHFDYAALAIGFAIPFDALDGRIARMTNTTSEFGKELDSLADVITFGVAPSLLAYTWGFHALPFSLEHSLRHKLVELGALLCFLFLLCGASTVRAHRFLRIPDARGASTSSACLFPPPPALWPPSFISSEAFPSPCTGWRCYGASMWAASASSWSAPGASGAVRRSISRALTRSD